MSKSLPIKPWMFEFANAISEPIGDPSDVTAAFDENIRIWTRAEALDIEGIFFSEHHFWMSYSPSPNLFC